MNESLTIIAAHVARHLPDSISERKRVLRALEKILPERHPASRSVIAQLSSIEAIERLQSELPLHFE